MQQNRFDVIVVGGGHAGVEAATAAARGVIARAVSPMYLSAAPIQGLMLGFSGHEPGALRWAAKDPEAAPVLIGSHLDSIVQGGNFDGAAGVIAGIGAVAALQAAGVTPKRDIEVLALRCEEAVWFGLGLIGSRCLLARLPEGALDLPHARTGLTLAESIVACGGNPARLREGRPLRDPKAMGAYLELHIEQAPQLIEAGAPLAVCLANPGNVRHPFIRITGEDAHTGLPHRFRRAAALSGAESAELRRWIRGPEAERRRGRGLADRIGDLLGEDENGQKLLQQVLRAAMALPGPGWTRRVQAGQPDGLAENFLSLVRTQVLARAEQNAGSGHTIETDCLPLIDGLSDAAEELMGALLDLKKPMSALANALQSWPGGRAACIELRGNLGAGKTTLVRHLLRAAGVQGRIKSPTYAVVEPHQAGTADAAWPIWHFDFYRFNDPQEWEDAGFRDIFASPGLKLAEWPHQAAGRLPTPDLTIAIELCADETRQVHFSAYTDTGAALIQSLPHAL